MLEIYLVNNYWKLDPSSNEYYDNIHEQLSPELYSEVVDEDNITDHVRYWPIYFPIGILLAKAKKMGWNITLHY